MHSARRIQLVDERKALFRIVQAKTAELAAAVGNLALVEKAIEDLDKAQATEIKRQVPSTAVAVGLASDVHVIESQDEGGNFPQVQDPADYTRASSSSTSHRRSVPSHSPSKQKEHRNWIRKIGKFFSRKRSSNLTNTKEKSTSRQARGGPGPSRSTPTPQNGIEVGELRGGSDFMNVTNSGSNSGNIENHNKIVVNNYKYYFINE